MTDTPVYAVPDDMRIYAIGDVHGRLDLLKAMEAAIAQDLQGFAGASRIITLGDYIDRGPESRGVIEFLMARADGKGDIAWACLRGNHEDGMFEFLDDPLHQDWLKWGGIETCASYCVLVDGDLHHVALDEKRRVAEAMQDAMPAEHVAFLKALPISMSYGDYLFVHAGIDPLKPLSEQSDRDFTRSRKPFLDWHENLTYQPLEKKVVHGHSIEDAPSNLPHRVGVDTCAFGRGVLSAAVLEGRDIRFLQVRE